MTTLNKPYAQLPTNRRRYRNKPAVVDPTPVIHGAGMRNEELIRYMWSSVQNWREEKAMRKPRRHSDASVLGEACQTVASCNLSALCN